MLAGGADRSASATALEGRGLDEDGRAGCAGSWAQRPRLLNVSRESGRVAAAGSYAETSRIRDAGW
ncbi:hypothetical protein GCM10010472_52120 [Pseudonocardia halophobica]|uniref:Uncharacterized protein n=1 Tax=Pseudonocardia halophobica TaxID=29401 RepID=A0A9W6L156_9PSEU|nr:hypothetical protein GCM10017577_24890 [Pseudonocardia halophobica]